MRAFLGLPSRRYLDIEPLTPLNLDFALSTAISFRPGAARYNRETELLP
jgi:hypothetical protein